jgi:hypothetical protein
LIAKEKEERDIKIKNRKKYQKMMENVILALDDKNVFTHDLLLVKYKK